MGASAKPAKPVGQASPDVPTNAVTAQAASSRLNGTVRPSGGAPRLGFVVPNEGGARLGLAQLFRHICA